MSLLHQDPSKKAGRRTKKTLNDRNRGLPARTYIGKVFPADALPKRAGHRAPKGKSPKAIRDARIQKKRPVQKKGSLSPPAKKKDLRLFELNPLPTPLEFFVKLLATLTMESGFYFKEVEPTENRFSKAVESVADDRHHATVKIQAGPKDFHCRIWFADPRKLSTLDSILLEFEEALQADCGLEIHYWDQETLMSSFETDARVIVNTFGAYALARARLAAPTQEFRDNLSHLVREAKQLMRPAVG